MAAIDWAPTDALLVAALATATYDDLLIGGGIRATLRGLGEAYDLVYGPAAEASKAERAGHYAAAVALWDPLVQASHNQADRAARYAEELQLATQAASASPLLYGGRILAPASAIPWSYPDEPVIAAALTTPSWQASTIGTIDVSTIDYSALVGTTMTIQIVGASSIVVVVNFIAGITTPSALAAAVQAPSAGRLDPYLSGNQLVIATAPSTTTESVIVSSGTALPLLGFSTNQTGAGVYSTFGVIARQVGVLGNATIVTVGAASDGVNEHMKLTITWHTYVEEFDDVDPRALPSVAKSLLLSSLITTSNGRPRNGTYVLSGGSGGAHAQLVARLANAAAFPATKTNGQASMITAHTTDYAIAYSEAPALEPWLYLAPIPSAGISNEVPLSKDGRIDVYNLEQALAAELVLAQEFLAEFTWVPS